MIAPKTVLELREKVIVDESSALNKRGHPRASSQLRDRRERSSSRVETVKMRWGNAAEKPLDLRVTAS